MARKENTSRPRKKENVSVAADKDFVAYTPNKLAYKKAGVNYNPGDSVQITDPVDGMIYGKLLNVLSSQLVVLPDGSTNPRFFFTSGLKISKSK
jgi:hypothetical protein